MPYLEEIMSIHVSHISCCPLAPLPNMDGVLQLAVTGFPFCNQIKTCFLKYLGPSINVLVTEIQSYVVEALV